MSGTARRRVSSRRLLSGLRIGHEWLDSSGNPWQVGQIHRKDSQVELRRGASRVFVTFDELLRSWETPQG